VHLQVNMKASPGLGNESSACDIEVNMKVLSRAESWTIGDLAGKVGVPTHVLRHWESLGLLEPQRDASGYRRYGRDDLVRVVAIQRNKAAGMTLEQIGVLLDSGAAGRHEVLTAHLKDIEDRMQALERSRAMTEHALACRAHDVAACPRFASTVADLVEGRLATLPRHDASGRPIDH
jgi:MerR family copper efflux transcriptional regulator